MKTKLLSYSGAASAFLLASINELKSQIIYTDIDPDVYISGDPVDYYMDLNLDGEFEVHFDHIGNFYGSVGCLGFVVPNYSYCFISYQYDSLAMYSFAKVFESGDIIFGGFNNAPGAINLQHADGSSTYGLGPWISPDDKFVGFVFETPAAAYYAWVRLQVDECGYTIKDYAYSPVPIIAGAGIPADICESPAATYVTGIEAEKAKISWDAVPGATTYNVRFRAVGEIDWHEKTVDAPKTFVKLKALSCDTDYEWQVQADCDGGPSDYTEIAGFSTLSCRIGDAADAGFDIYPNPANTVLNVELENELNGDAFMQITDFTGKIVMQQNLSATLTGIDLTELPSGIYILTVFENGNMNKKEFIKQ